MKVFINLLILIITINSFSQEKSFIKEFNSIYYINKGKKITTEVFRTNIATYNNIKNTLVINVNKENTELTIRKIKFLNGKEFTGNIDDITILGKVSDNSIMIIFPKKVLILKNSKVLNFINKSIPFNKNYKKVISYVKNEEGKYIKIIEADDVNYTVNFRTEKGKIETKIIDNTYNEDNRIYKTTKWNQQKDEDGFINQSYIGENQDKEKVVLKLSTRHLIVYNSGFMIVYQNK